LAAIGWFYHQICLYYLPNLDILLRASTIVIVPHKEVLFIMSSNVILESCCVSDAHGMSKPSLENLWSLEAIGMRIPAQ